MPFNKEGQRRYNKMKMNRYRKWQKKYPDLKQQTYINFETAKKMGLPLKEGDTRTKDHKIFKQYYQRPSLIGAAIREHWTSPDVRREDRRRGNERKAKTKIANRNFVKRYKKLVGCTICGWNKSTWGLHFDHIDPKDKTRDVSQMIKGGRLSLKKEMRKCRLICANCHSIHTEQQHHSKKYGWHLGGKKEEITAPVQLQLKL